MALLRPRRRRLLLFGLGAAAAVLAGGVFLRAQLPRPGVTVANYQRIRDGMTVAEVEAILGGPPGTYDGPDDAFGGQFQSLRFKAIPKIPDRKVKRKPKSGPLSWRELHFPNNSEWDWELLGALHQWYDEHSRVVIAVVFDDRGRAIWKGIDERGLLYRLRHLLPW